MIKPEIRSRIRSTPAIDDQLRAAKQAAKYYGLDSPESLGNLQWAYNKLGFEENLDAEVKEVENFFIQYPDGLDSVLDTRGNYFESKEEAYNAIDQEFDPVENYFEQTELFCDLMDTWLDKEEDTIEELDIPGITGKALNLYFTGDKKYREHSLSRHRRKLEEAEREYQRWSKGY